MTDFDHWTAAKGAGIGEILESGILNFESAMRSGVAPGRLRTPKLRHSKFQTCAGLLLLAALLWVTPLQARGDTSTRQSRSGAGKTKSVKGTAKKRSTTKGHSTVRRASSTGSGQHASTHHPATPHISPEAARAAADRRRRAQLRPAPERIQQIQQALAQAGYFKAEPNGTWDDQTRDAMRRYQTDHGFPVTGLPEAKSLMKLGLGQHPLPPELETSSPAAPGAATPSQTPATSDAQQNPPASAPNP